MSMCRCAPRSCARRSSGRSRSAASRLPRSGASGRSSGVNAETFTDRFARGSGPALSCSSCVARGPALGGAGDRVQRVRAAVGVALRLGLGHRRLAEQVDRRRDAVLPQVLAGRPSAAFGSSPTMKRCAMCLTPAAAAIPSARRPALVLPIFIATPTERRRLVDLAQEGGQVAREVVEVAARGHDVDEAKQRGLELGVRGRHVHRLVVEHLQRVARRRQRRGQLATHLEQLAFYRPLVGHGCSLRRRYPAPHGSRAATAQRRGSDVRGAGDRRPVHRAGRRRRWATCPTS